MADKVQKIREEVGKRYEYWKEKEFNSHSIESEIRMSECQHLLLMLDTLQEEPVSEDLEIAANDWNAKALFTPFYMTLDDKGNPNGVRQDYTTHAESFKAGADWQKGQMMSKAVDGIARPDDGEIWCDLKSFNFKDGDKVKVIIIKDK